MRIPFRGEKLKRGSKQKNGYTSERTTKGGHQGEFYPDCFTLDEDGADESNQSNLQIEATLRRTWIPGRAGRKQQQKQEIRVPKILNIERHTDDMSGLHYDDPVSEETRKKNALRDSEKAIHQEKTWGRRLSSLDLLFKKGDKEQPAQQASPQEEVIVRVLSIDSQDFSTLGIKSKSMTEDKKKSLLRTKTADVPSTVVEGDSGEETAATDNETLSQTDSLTVGNPTTKTNGDDAQTQDGTVSQFYRRSARKPEYVSDLVDDDINVEGCQGVIQPCVNVADDLRYLMNLVMRDTTAACHPSIEDVKDKNDRKSRKRLSKKQQKHQLELR